MVQIVPKPLSQTLPLQRMPSKRCYDAVVLSTLKYPLTAVVRLLSVATRLLLSIGIFAYAAHGHGADAQALRIPLTVHEALPAGISGVPRSNEPVALGVPLPVNGGFRSEKEFSLSGATAGQFRVLGRWPNGNIKWLLTDFQATVTAGGTATVELTKGQGNFGGRELAVDRGSSIEIDTGHARFNVRKGGFSLFNSVEVAGTQLLSKAQGGLLMRSPSNEVYSSANDPESTVVIEDNGPVRAVLRATGSFKNKAGARLADYTLRMHFFKGKAYVKSSFVLRNARKSHASALFFNSAEAVIPLATDATDITFARKSDVVTKRWRRGEHAHLYQGFSDDKLIYVSRSCGTWEAPVAAICSKNSYQFEASNAGLDIEIGGESISKLGASNEWSRGWAALHEVRGKTVVTAMRWMSAYWPSGFELDAEGRLSVEIFSKRNSKEGLKLGFGKHEAREIVWDFDASLPGSYSLYRLQYPLVARAAFEHYRDTGVIYGQSELPSLREQAEFFARYRKAKIAPVANPAFNGVFRAWPWPMGGGNNGIDFPLADLIDYLRSGLPGFYLAGEQRSFFNAHAAVAYSDDFSVESNFPVRDAQPKRNSINGGFFDAEHAHMMSLPLFYFMSGDEAMREAVLEYGEQLERGQLRKYFAIPDTGHIRAWSRHYRNFALIHEFTCNIGSCNDRYRRYVENATSALLDSRDNPSLTVKSPHGRNLARGYLYWDAPLVGAFGMRVIHSFFHTQIHFEAVWQGLRIMRDLGWDYPRKEDTEDYLHGLALFFLEEYYDDLGGDAVTDVGFAYDYPLDVPYRRQSRVTPYSMSRAAVFAFERTGDVRHLEKGGNLVWRVMQYQTARHASELPELALIAAESRRPATWRKLDLEVVPAGDSYKLRWRTPADATRLQIKYASKEIVEWLGFDRASRTYRHDPQTHVAYFAARSIKRESLLQPAPAEQELTVTGLECRDSCKFSMKYLAAPSLSGRGTASVTSSSDKLPTSR